MPSPSRRSRLAAILAVPLTLAVLAAIVLPGEAATATAGTTASRAVSATSSAYAVTAATTVATDTSPLVVIGFAGVRWQDVTAARTPALWSLLEHGSSADVTVRAVHSATCPVDGWLTVSAAQRAADLPPPGSRNPPPCTAPGVPATTGSGVQSVSVPRWADYAKAAAGSDFDPDLGLLSDEMDRAGRCATAIGPGAAIALADHSGQTPRYLAPGSDLATTVRGVITSCPLTVVDAGAVRGPGNLPLGERSSGVAMNAQIQQVDQRIGAVLSVVPSTATVLVVGLADSDLTPHLRILAMTGPGYGPGLLDAPSTRQRGFVQLTDITPTILAHEGLPIGGTLGGTPLVRRSGAAGSLHSRLQQLLDYDTAAQQVHTAVPRFFSGLVFGQLFLYLLAAVVLRRRWTGERGRERTLRAVRRISVVFAAVPVSTFLANVTPWWRAGHPILALTGSVAFWALLIYAVAAFGPWRRRPLGDVIVVAGTTLIVLALDVMTGSRLQIASLMGLQPVVAGRFYGMGNVTYALFATGGLFLATALADPFLRAGRRRAAGIAVIVTGVFTVFVDGWPGWGADFGGPPASVPAFAFLALAVLGLRLSWRRVLAIVGGTVVIVSAGSIIDWLRPPDERTHLGRFVQTVIDGGAWPVLQRKLDQNLDILFSSDLSVLVPVGVLFVILILWRPTSWGANSLQRAFDRSPVLRSGVIAVLVVWIIGFALNDSGTAIPAISATLGIPLLIACSISALQSDPVPADPAPDQVPDEVPDQVQESTPHPAPGPTLDRGDPSSAPSEPPGQRPPRGEPSPGPA